MSWWWAVNHWAAVTSAYAAPVIFIFNFIFNFIFIFTFIFCFVFQQLIFPLLPSHLFYLTLFSSHFFSSILFCSLSWLQTTKGSLTHTLHTAPQCQVCNFTQPLQLACDDKIIVITSLWQNCPTSPFVVMWLFHNARPPEPCEETFLLLSGSIHTVTQYVLPPSNSCCSWLTFVEEPSHPVTQSVYFTVTQTDSKVHKSHMVWVAVNTNIASGPAAFHSGLVATQALGLWL